MTGLTQISAIEAPAVLLDLAKLESNLSSMQQLADRHGVALRPHAKTHKSVEIAKRQLALALHLGRSTQLQTRAEVASAKAIDMRTSYI